MHIRVYGIYLEQVKASGLILPHWTIQSNSDFELKVDNLKYSTKAPSGFYGVSSAWKLSEVGVTIRLEPGDTLNLVIQDDLSGLATFKCWLYGHTVE